MPEVDLGLRTLHSENKILLQETESQKSGHIHKSNYTFYIMSTPPPPIGWGLTLCFTAVGVLVGVTPIYTKGPPAQIFLGWHVFCSPGHWLLISTMTLTFGVKVKRFLLL